MLERAGIAEESEFEGAVAAGRGYRAQGLEVLGCSLRTFSQGTSQCFLIPLESDTKVDIGLPMKSRRKGSLQVKQLSSGCSVHAAVLATVPINCKSVDKD